MKLMCISLNDVKSRIFVENSARPNGRQKLLEAFAICSDVGGAYRDRTDDLLNANQALSQLS